MREGRVLAVERVAAREQRASDSLLRWLSALAIALFCWGVPDSAYAQCGGPTSSCRDCHENRRAGPFIATSPWHVDHAIGDFCSNCHGGSSTTADEGAHAGLTDPLAHEGERCQLCHADRPRIVDRYLALLRPTQASKTWASPTQPAPHPPSVTSTQPMSGRRNVVCVAVIVVIGLAAAGYAAARECGADVFRNELSGVHRRSEWSPYASGAMLGVVVTVSMAVFGRRLSGSGAYQELAGPLGRALFPSSVYWTQVIRPTEHWNSVVLVGAVAGASIAALLGGRFRIRWLPDSQWADAFGPAIGKRWLIAFIGAALTALGAGIAGGCTASLAVSGGAALSPGAFAFMAGMFAAGIPTAWLVYRNHSR